MYHSSIWFSWIAYHLRAEEEWKIHNSDHRQWQILLKRSWHSNLPLVADVFIWRVLIGGLPLGLALKRREPVTCNCLFCTVQMDSDDTHHFKQMPDCLSRFGATFLESGKFLSGNYLKPKQWGVCTNYTGLTQNQRMLFLDKKKRKERKLLEKRRGISRILGKSVVGMLDG